MKEALVCRSSSGQKQRSVENNSVAQFEADGTLVTTTEIENCKKRRNNDEEKKKHPARRRSMKLVEGKDREKMEWRTIRTSCRFTHDFQVKIAT